MRLLVRFFFILFLAMLGLLAVGRLSKMRHLSLTINNNLLYFSETCRKYFMFSDKKEKNLLFIVSSNNDLTKILSVPAKHNIFMRGSSKK